MYKRKHNVRTKLYKVIHILYMKWHVIILDENTNVNKIK